MPEIHLYFETMAGTHLLDAVEALRDSGSADALYDTSLRATDAEDLDWPDVSVARDLAEGRRVAHSRRALLFAAFAAEAYANDFLYKKWTGPRDREALQKLSPVDKYALLSTLSGATTTLDRGAEPLQRIKWLFDRRNELVHAKPHGDRDLTWDPDNHNPLDAARSIVAVAEAAAQLNGAPKGSAVCHVLAERQAMLNYGQQALDGLPEIHDSPGPDLLSAARRRDWTEG